MDLLQKKRQLEKIAATNSTENDYCKRQRVKTKLLLLAAGEKGLLRWQLKGKYDSCSKKR